MKNFFRFINFGIVLPLLVVLISNLFGISGTALDIIIWASLIFFMLFLLAYIYGSGSNKYKYDKKMSIYEWMDEADNDNEHLLTPLKTSLIHFKTIDNLKALKITVMKQTNEDLESLKLYKAFYNQVSKETMEELYFKTALIILSSLAVFVIRDYIAGIAVGSKVIGFAVFFIFLINVAFISQKIIANKKRVGLLLEILDICIEEVEERKKDGNGGESCV